MPAVFPAPGDPSLFHVDLHALAKENGREEGSAADPWLLARALLAILAKCPHQSAAGRPLPWNVYQVILSADDHRFVSPLEKGFYFDLAEVMDTWLITQEAVLLGPLQVTLLLDEAGQLPKGLARVYVEHDSHESVDFPRVPGPEDTVLLHPQLASAPEEGTGIPSPTLVPEDVFGPTETDPPPFPTPPPSPRPGLPSLRLRWPGGEAFLPRGHRIVLGRPHPHASPEVLPLHGASMKISKRHAWIEVLPEGLRLGRFADANPVTASSSPLKPGEVMEIQGLPMEIILSHGELRLWLEEP